MASILVSSDDSRSFDVTVESDSVTRHRVTLDPVYYQMLAGGKVDEERLIEASFEFLLERESNTAILGEFDLSVIRRYFPEYEIEIMKML